MGFVFRLVYSGCQLQRPGRTARGYQNPERLSDWMKAMMTVLPGRHLRPEVVCRRRPPWQRHCHAVFNGSHTGPGGPMLPTGKQASTEYVYVMQFSGDKISHMTKIWNAP